VYPKVSGKCELTVTAPSVNGGQGSTDTATVDIVVEPAL
jgi:hypothetical protein